MTGGLHAQPPLPENLKSEDEGVTSFALEPFRRAGDLSRPPPIPFLLPSPSLSRWLSLSLFWRPVTPGKVYRLRSNFRKGEG